MSAIAIWRKGGLSATIYIDGKRAGSIPVPACVERVESSGPVIYLYGKTICYLYDCSSGYPRNMPSLYI